MNKETKITPYIDAGRKMMIWRRKMIDKGFTEKEYEQFEEDVFRGYISEDVAKTLQKSTEVQKETIGISTQVKEDSKRASLYFGLSVLVAIGGILISIAIHLSG